MSVESINEPGNSRLTMLEPASINEPPAPGDGVDGELNPPRATGMDPTGCAIGDAPLTLHVTGTDFTTDTLIVFDEVPSVTTFVSDTELTLDLNPAAFVDARGYPVTVALGPFTASPAMMFTVTATRITRQRDVFTPMH
jgi:hypothetical protein